MVQIDYSRYTISYIIIIVFVLVLLIIAAIQIFGKPSSTLRRYPPWISECPDYWDKVIVNGAVSCRRSERNPNGRMQCSAAPNSYNASYSPPPQALNYIQDENVNFNRSSLVDRCKWAQACDVYWEGISDQNCTDTTHFSQYSLPARLSPIASTT